MKIKDYIDKCLTNPEFKQYWDNNIQVESFELTQLDSMSLWEALNSIEDDTLQDIVKNRGIKSTVDIPTTIEFFETKTSCPVAEFLDSIEDQKLKTKTLKNILNLAIQGSTARPPMSEHVGDGIFELRTKQSSNITCVFYFFIFGNKIIMTNGYIKKSQKMDKSEFNKAKKYRDIHISELYS